MTRVIACLRRICVDCADILVPDTKLGTPSVSLLALEDVVLSISIFPSGRARASAFVDVLFEYMDQVHVSERSDLTPNP